MIVEQEGVTDKKHLVKTIQEKSSFVASEHTVEYLVDNHLEHCQEIYVDGVISGYLLVFNFFGVRSFHGYKLIEGYGTRAFRLAKAFIKKFKVFRIVTTIDQLKTIRLARLLGFAEKQRIGNCISFERA